MGQTMVTAAWKANVPSGWTCVNGDGSGGVQFALFDGDNDLIALEIVAGTDVATACGPGLVGQGATTTALPDTKWGGKTAKTVKVAVMGVESQARCVNSNGTVYVLIGDQTQGTYASVITAMDALTASWVWK
jgi:hypothetical protein